MTCTGSHVSTDWRLQCRERQGHVAHQALPGLDCLEVYLPLQVSNSLIGDKHNLAMQPTGWR